MFLSDRNKRLVRRLLPWTSLAGGIWSAFAVGRTWNEVHWIGWVLAAAWAAAASVGLLERIPVDRLPERARSAARFLAGTASQSASQEVLFFVLPFWIRSTTFLSANGPFTLLLLLVGASTLVDPLYLGRILPHRIARTVFTALVQFACLDFLLAALTSRSTVECVAIAGAWSGSMAGFHLSRRRGVLWGALGGLALAWSLRLAIAPVPFHLNHPVVCSGVERQVPVDTLRTVERGSEVWFWSPIFVPPGRIDSIRHVWSRDGERKASILLPTAGGRSEGFRTWSNSRLVAAEPGSARVRVLLVDGQLLGEARFEVAVP